MFSIDMEYVDNEQYFTTLRLISTIKILRSNIFLVHRSKRLR